MKLMKENGRQMFIAGFAGDEACGSSGLRPCTQVSTHVHETGNGFDRRLHAARSTSYPTANHPFLFAFRDLRSTGGARAYAFVILSCGWRG